MGKIVKKVYYKIEFKLASSMTIGSGENQFTDKDIVRNSRGIPYIPGSALAGINRSFFSDNQAIINKYFGTILGNQKSVESQIVFYDANMTSDENSYIVSKRDSVALDVYKTAIDGAKFDMETLEPGIRFVTYIEQNYLDEKEEAIAEEIVKHWLAEDVYLGAKTMRGYGAIEDVSVWKKEFSFGKESDLEQWLKFDMYCEQDWKNANVMEMPKMEKSYMLRLELKQAGGISIRKYTTEVPEPEQKSFPDYEQLTLYNQEETLPVIPGHSWAGAFRHRMLQLVPDLDEKLCFGLINDEEKIKSNIRFSETQIAHAHAKVYSRNSINRFTGGTVDHALFTEKTYYGGETTLEISFKKNPSDSVKWALAASIADLHNGFLAVGGLTSIGRGCFEVECVNGAKTDGEKIYEQVLELMRVWEG